MTTPTVDPSVAPYARPLPLMEPETVPYWQSLEDHQLRIQRCSACARYFFPPAAFCPHCLSDEVVWTPVSGRGTVYSWVTYHRAYQPDYEQDIPYNASIIELDEGAFLWSNVVGVPPSAVRRGMRVQVEYHDVTPEVTLTRFRPVEE